MSEYLSISESFRDLSSRITSEMKKIYSQNATMLELIGWQSPAIKIQNLAELSTNLANRIDFFFENSPPDDEKLGEWLEIEKQAKSINVLNFRSDPLGVFNSTSSFLYWVSSMLPPSIASVDWKAVEDKDLLPKSLMNKLKGIESRLKEIAPKTEKLEDTIKTIEDAREAADSLPTDMRELKQARYDIARNLSETNQNAKEVSDTHDEAQKILNVLITLHKKAEELVDKCDESYRITTSAGLAGAFNERSKSLQRTGWAWVLILAISLASGSGLAAMRFTALLEHLGDGMNVHPTVTLIHFIGALMGVGAAIWVAWLSTKNIGNSFKLSEDYAFKSSISKAYEGYRREAVNLDDEFAKQLFGSALTRLDELPSRFFEDADHSSPLEALLDQPIIKSLVQNVPAAKHWLLENMTGDKDLLNRTKLIKNKKTETDTNTDSSDQQ